MDWHRALVIVLLAVTTVLALHHLSSFEPQAAAEPTGTLQRQDFVPASPTAHPATERQYAGHSPSAVA